MTAVIGFVPQNMYCDGLSTSAIDIAWQPPVVQPPFYRVDKRPHDVGPDDQLGWQAAILNLPGTATSAAVNGLVPATTYDIRVACTDGATIGAYVILRGVTTLAG